MDPETLCFQDTGYQRFIRKLAILDFSENETFNTFE